MSHDTLMRNRAWRSIVGWSRQSPKTFLGFAAACTVVAYGIAEATQRGTNPEETKALLGKTGEQLAKRGGLDAQMLARANKERLGILLEEARTKKNDNERYRRALNGESYGTHSSGTTVKATAIEK
eukprot:CAMPEP_0198247106 /NCGR_PEP_ID=MMETSP1446-20131203/46313_1 /TAXON_ID=1461542 ORGANISM="Unidentified sp, Strain CCMP2111" /NCGR_SAMPLE_ID=MMETSP1446 /ASSEMBLY_ACC=CAM_ASM_001112 /LENGTH=125 /DNA_ID=CAMNT_0043931431 /DNA_START=252 /DNA_END=629 /DNA_ORIENTATION=+